MPTTSESYASLLQDMANITLSALRSEFHQSWEWAYVDLRSPPSGGSGIGKFRVFNKDGVEVAMDSLPSGLSAILLLDIAPLKPKLFEKPWFGIRLAVYPDGKHEVQYNYDPDCINDSTFYDVIRGSAEPVAAE